MFTRFYYVDLIKGDKFLPTVPDRALLRDKGYPMLFS